MAADIFTKPFPDSKITVWRSNLSLINIMDKAQSTDIDYHPSVVRSMRGDLDKPAKAVPIETALLSDDDDSIAAKPGTPAVADSDDEATN